MRQVIRVLKTPVTLIILLAMLGYGAVWGYTHLTAPEPRKEQTCVMTDVGANLTPDRVTVRVLNGGEEGGLAKRMSLFLRAHGFRVVFFNNASERVPNTVILGSSPEDPEVMLLKQFFTDATTKGDGRGDHVVDVILNKDTHIEEPVATFPVNGPVCLPPIAAASPSATPSTSVTPKATATKK